MVCQGPSVFLKLLIEKEHNFKNIVFRVTPLTFQLYFVMMSKFSMFGVDDINTF